MLGILWTDQAVRRGLEVVGLMDCGERLLTVVAVEFATGIVSPSMSTESVACVGLFG